MRYKAITTVSFQFESNDPQQKALEYARQKLEEILNDSPTGKDFGSFSVQLNLVRLKEKQKLQRIGEFELEEVLPYITSEDSRKDYTVNGVTYSVKMNSDRYFVFLKNLECAACGLVGNKIMLELNPGDNVPHFNLYAIDKDREVLMTKDHILAKSKGGENKLDNYQNMCCICNNLKSNHDLNLDAVRELRELYNNSQKLPKRELKNFINKRIEELEIK